MLQRSLAGTLALLAISALAGAGEPTQTAAKPAAPSPVVVPRDSASGIPTGKRQHSPIVFQKATDLDADGAADKAASPPVAGKDQDCDDADLSAVTKPAAPTSAASGKTQQQQAAAAQPPRDGQDCRGRSPVHHDHSAHGKIQ